MFTSAGILFFLAGCIPLFMALRKRSERSEAQHRAALRRPVVLLTDVAAIVLFVVFGSIVANLQWFRNPGYGQRYWTLLYARVLLFAIGAVVSFAVITVFLKTASGKTAERNPSYRFIVSLCGALIMGAGLSMLWQRTSLYVSRTGSGTLDPVFGKSLDFYLFLLSFFSGLLVWLTALLLFITLAVITGRFVSFLLQYDRSGSNPETPDVRKFAPVSGILFFLAGLLLLLAASGAYLAIFKLLYTSEGVVHGVGYVDYHFRRPGYLILMAGYSLTAMLCFGAAFSERMRQSIFSIKGTPLRARRLLVVPLLLVLVRVVSLTVIPSLVTAFLLSPNEITLERPFIRHNIDCTRKTFGIDDSTIIHRVYTLGPEITQKVIDYNTDRIENSRLWDPRGSEVIRGNILAIPLSDARSLHILYVEPIFLQAENAGLPEIKRLIVAGQQQVVWANDFNTSLDRLTGSHAAFMPHAITTTAADAELR